MISSINVSQFLNEFKQLGREGDFSYEGCLALFEYLEEMYEREYNLDVIELCCMFTEYLSIQEFWADYAREEYPDKDSIIDSFSVIVVNEWSDDVADFDNMQFLIENQ